MVPTAWGEIGRRQPDYPGKLIARSAEVITYRGHTNNHASAQLRGLPHRARSTSSSTTGRWSRDVRRGPPRELFDDVHAAGGFTQINHPTIFPSNVPFFQQFCRGCPWDYTDAETDYSKVDAIEVNTGPAPPRNPYTLSAIAFYEQALNLGAKIAAVGASDSHNAGRTAGFLSPQAPVGTPATIVYADELSEGGHPPGDTGAAHLREAHGRQGAGRALHRAGAGQEGQAEEGAARHDRRHGARRRGGLHGAGAGRVRRHRNPTRSC